MEEIRNAEKNTPGHGLLAKAKERGTAMLACDCCFFGPDIDDCGNQVETDQVGHCHPIQIIHFIAILLLSQ